MDDIDKHEYRILKKFDRYIYKVYPITSDYQVYDTYEHIWNNSMYRWSCHQQKVTKPISEIEARLRLI